MLGIVQGCRVTSFDAAIAIVIFIFAISVDFKLTLKFFDIELVLKLGLVLLRQSLANASLLLGERLPELFHFSF